MKLRLLRWTRSRRLYDTRPATFLDHFICGLNYPIAKRHRIKHARHTYEYARDLFEWTPFWPALLWNRQDRRPR